MCEFGLLGVVLIAAFFVSGSNIVCLLGKSRDCHYRVEVDVDVETWQRAFVYDGIGKFLVRVAQDPRLRVHIALSVDWTLGAIWPFG